jgi:hypothetical protein
MSFVTLIASFFCGGAVVAQPPPAGVFAAGTTEGGHATYNHNHSNYHDTPRRRLGLELVSTTLFLAATGRLPARASVLKPLPVNQHREIQ